MFFTVANHNQSKNSKGFVNYDDVEFEDIPEIVTSGYAYSAGKFKNEHRNNDNWEGYVDVIILDIDDGCTIEQAQKIFKKYSYFIVTTKSHQKEKNGYVCDRFRIFLNVSQTIYCPKLMDSLMVHVMTMFPFVDKSCKDRGRYFFSSPSDAIIFSNIGAKFNVITPINVTITTLQATKEPQPIKYTSDDVYKFCELTNMWRDKNGNELESTHNEGSINYEAKLKGARKFLDDNFYSGNRNNAVFGCMCMLKNDGLNEDDIVNFMIAENDSRGGIPLKELMMVWRSVERL